MEPGSVKRCRVPRPHFRRFRSARAPPRFRLPGPPAPLRSRPRPRSGPAAARGKSRAGPALPSCPVPPQPRPRADTAAATLGSRPPGSCHGPPGSPRVPGVSPGCPLCPPRVLCVAGICRHKRLCRDGSDRALGMGSLPALPTDSKWCFHAGLGRKLGME